MSTEDSGRRLLIDSIRDYLEQLREEGIDGPPRVSRREPATSISAPPPPESAPLAATAPPRPDVTNRTAAPAAVPTQELAATSVRAAVAAPAAANGLFALYPDLEKTADLEAVRAFIGDCRRCKLHSGRTNIVFGTGNPAAELMFVGEAPGADEDERGEPFVGRAGQLLTDIIERGMRMRRADVYICNVIKCRPPGNRNPEADEVAACEPFLNRQIELVKPQVIVGLGTFAVQALLKVKTPISKLRGNWHEMRGIRMMPTFHPAYLLRNPGDKRLVWADIQEVMKALGKEIPGRRPG